MKLYKTYKDSNIDWNPTERIYAPLVDIIGAGLLVSIVIMHREHPRGQHLATTYWNNTFTNFSDLVPRNYV